MVGELGTGRSAWGRGLQPSEAGRHRAGAEGLRPPGPPPVQGPHRDQRREGPTAELHRGARSRVSEAAISEKPKSISHGWSSVARNTFARRRSRWATRWARRDRHLLPQTAQDLGIETVRVDPVERPAVDQVVGQQVRIPPGPAPHTGAVGCAPPRRGPGGRRRDLVLDGASQGGEGSLVTHVLQADHAVKSAGRAGRPLADRRRAPSTNTRLPSSRGPARNGEADLLFQRSDRMIRLKNVGDERPFSSLRRTVEHEALRRPPERDVEMRTPRLRCVARVRAGFVLAGLRPDRRPVARRGRPGPTRCRGPVRSVAAGGDTCGPTGSPIAICTWRTCSRHRRPPMADRLRFLGDRCLRHPAPRGPV